MPCDPGPAAWNTLLPDATLRATLAQNRVADWLVIGAGFTGLSAARRLSELHPGDNIVVLDATRIANGPSGRNSGFMIDLPHDLTSDDYGGNAEKDQRHIRLNRAGIHYALAAKKRFHMDNETITASGKINGAMSARGLAHNTAYAKHLDRLREPYERLDASDMQSITGTDCYIDGLFSPGTVMIQPAMFVRQLAQNIESMHLHLYEQSPVTRLHRENNNWVAHTPTATVTSPRVILSVNGHLESFGFSKRRLMHIFTYGSMTRALSKDEVKRLGGKSTWALTPADPLGTTVRRTSGTGGDRLIIRNRATFDASLTVDDNRIARVAQAHDQSFLDRFPMLDGVQMEYRWGGRLCLSRNNVPVFGEIDQQLFAACCQNGLGTAKGTIAGKLIAELASAESSSLLDDQQAEAEARKLPPEPIASIAANAVLRWGEFRAGKEL